MFRQGTQIQDLLMIQIYVLKLEIEDQGVVILQTQFEMSLEEENAYPRMKVDSKKFTYLHFYTMKRVLTKNTYQRY